MMSNPDGAGARRHRRHRRRGGPDARSRAAGACAAIAPPAAGRAATASTGGRATRWSPADVAAAAEGADLIVHAVNPPGYRDWDELVLPMLENTIAAARAAGARDPAARHDLQLRPRRLPAPRRGRAAAPGHPQGRDPRARWSAGCARPPRPARRCSSSAPATSSARAPATTGSARAGEARPAGRGRSPCPAPAASATRGPTCPTSPRRWCGSSRPASRKGFASFHMDGHWDPDGMAMSSAIRARRSASPTCRCAGCPGALLRLAAPVVPLFRELAEMRYLWEQPVRLGNRRLVAALGTGAAHAARPRGAGDARRLVCLPAGPAAVPPFTNVASWHATRRFRKERAG